MKVFKFLHGNHDKFNGTLNSLIENKFIEKIFNKDFLLWADKPDEITNRLDWLTSPDEYITQIKDLQRFSDEIKNSGIKKIVLLGMGGSSLAPEVFMNVFGNFEGYPELIVIDTTHPHYILSISEKLYFEETLFIVSTKSGGTAETVSLMKYFYNKVYSQLKNKTGEHFVAITDPGSSLEKIAKEFSFRKIFLNNPNIGGRFSALSYFGLVPAALIGVDLKKLLNISKRFAEETVNLQSKANKALLLGSFLGMFAEEGKDKLTLIFEGKLKYVTPWIEQLVAESTGKLGKGILPVPSDKTELPIKYSRDRIFVYAYVYGEDKNRLAVENLKRNGFPVFEIALDDIYQLGAFFYIWEFATAVAGHIMRINPFDQPDVESAKVAAREALAEYMKTKNLPDAGEGVYFKDAIYFPVKEVKPLGKLVNELFCKISECLDDFLGRPYVSIQAFVQPNSSNEKILQKFADFLFQKYNVAVTFGFGPRFLHSTGQLHKGDSGNGIFIQFAEKTDIELPIPNNLNDEKADITFDILFRSQSIGDRKALLSKGRKVLRVEIYNNLSETVDRIIDILSD